MFSEAYRFNMRCMHPAVVPIYYALLYMIQSAAYIFSPDFISTFKKIDQNEAQILWHMTFNPTEVRIKDVLTLIFNPLSYGKKVIDFINVVRVHFFIIKFVYIFLLLNFRFVHATGLQICTAWIRRSTID
jgi:hypothetical protein